MEKPIADTYAEQVRLINPDKPIKCYRNLSRRIDDENGFWSVRQGTVKFHCRMICLTNATFPVNERVRQRVVANKVKEVHAFVCGLLSPEIPSGEIFNVRYNPYQNTKFTTDVGDVEAAEKCCLVKAGSRMMVVASGLKLYHQLTETVETHLL